MLKPSKTISTVGELKEWLHDVPDDTPISRTSIGFYDIEIIGDVSFFVGELPIGLTKEFKTVLNIFAG